MTLKLCICDEAHGMAEADALFVHEGLLLCRSCVVDSGFKGHALAREVNGCISCWAAGSPFLSHKVAGTVELKEQSYCLLEEHALFQERPAPTSSATLSDSCRHSCLACCIAIFALFALAGVVQSVCKHLSEAFL